MDSINFSSAPLKRNCPNRGNFCTGIYIRARNRVQVHRTIPHRLFRRRFALIIQMSLRAAEIIASYAAPLLSTTSLRGTLANNVREYIWKDREVANRRGRYYDRRIKYALIRHSPRKCRFVIPSLILTYFRWSVIRDRIRNGILFVILCAA